MFDNIIKKKLKNDNVVIGTFVALDNPDIVEIIGLTGFEFVVLDMEHGQVSYKNLVNLVRSAELSGMSPIVRTKNSSEKVILRALETGCHGIQVPQVNTRKNAKNIVNSVKYYPEGNRGAAIPRPSKYGLENPVEYFKRANEETMVVLQCESKESLNNLEKIAEETNVDVIFLGPFDLSMSLGIPGKVKDEEIEKAIEKLLNITKKHNISAGIFVTSAEEAKLRIKQGFKYITISMDTLVLSSGFKKILSSLN